MLIKALCDYYDILEKEGNVLAEGYSYVKIHYLVCLTKKGEIDEILPYQQKDVLKMMLVVFLGISLTSTFVSFVRLWILMHLSIKIDIPLMLGYFEHIYKLPMKFFASRKTGDITTRFSDAFTIKDIFTSIALSLIMDISMA